ncbi:type II toxin-antitoxin system PemK/MazF family toxin [Candidatus Poriferisodalis sp.]|uniref:type II toxin-antitoxin system PemK/MazF family toxin n=1 Tax=Candidatus Poriferisodalis sp. TaxID=3101277 RepID=UPI003AF5C5C2
MASVDELWLIDFGEPHPGETAFGHPALVLGPPNIFGSDFPLVIVAPLTTTWRGLSLHVEVEADESNGLGDTSYVQCELLRSVHRHRLVHRLGTLSADVSAQVDSIVRVLLNH